MNARSAIGVIAAMVVVLALVKFAGRGVSSPNAIASTRVVVVPFDAGPDPTARFVADSVVAELAQHLVAGSVTPILMAARPAGIETAAVRRQVGLNYQAGTMLTGAVTTHDGTVRIRLRLSDPASDSTMWELADSPVRSDRTMIEIARTMVEHLVQR